MSVMKSPAVFWTAVGAVLAGAAAFAFLKRAPAATALAAAVADAEEAVAAADAARPGAGGVEYRTGVERFVAGRRDLAEKFAGDRVRAAAKLSAWFAEVAIPDGADKPTRDEFQRGYAFHRDRLDNAVRDLLRKSGGPDVRETPTMKPSFLAGAPPREDEMLRWQRLANIERMLLEAAAKNGAFAAKALEIESEAAPLNDPEPNRARYRIRATFAAPTNRLPSLLEGLSSAGDDVGALVRLDGLSVRPGNPEWPVAPAEDPPVSVALDLGLSFPLPAGKESAR